MKKTILLSLNLILCFVANAQWNPSTADNLSVANVNSSDIVTKETTTGKTYAAFYSQNGSNYDMRAQLLDSNGNKLLGDDGILVCDRNSGSATFVFNACVDRDNSLIIAFQFTLAGYQRVVVCKIDTLGNRLWGQDGNGIVLGNGLAPYPVQLRNNDVIVAWNSDSGTVSYQKLRPSGKQVWDTPKTIKDTKIIERPQVVSNTAKSFTIVYQRVDIFPFYTHLLAQKFDIDGNPQWSSSTVLTNVITAGYRSYSVLAYGDTTFVGYYANPPSQNRFDGFLQRINPDGSLPWNVNGTEFATYSTQTQPYTLTVNIAHSQNSPTVWAVATMSDANQINYGISLQSFDANTGVRLLGNHGKTVFDLSAASYQQQGRLLLCNGNPLFMFTDVNNNVFATEVDSSGNFAWSQNILSLGTSTFSKGRFNFNKKTNSNEAIAVWQEDRGNGDMAYAQNVTCDGKTGTLSVTLMNFHGMYDNGVADLYWQTSQEINNTGFELQRSTDDNDFSPITFVSTRASNGNSTQLLSYSYVDIKVPAGDVYYRLKQIDRDGKSTYSSTLHIKSLAKPGINIYPNPVAGSLNIDFNTSANMQATIIVTDMAGKILLQQTQSIFSGYNALKINCSTLKPGMYILKTNSSNGSGTYMQKFIKQ